MISVVVPLYNKAAHIERALCSIRRQTLKPADVIVVDDGSTDGGGELVRCFKMTGLRLLSQDNQGVSAARNQGLDAARTDYVAFLDADDEWLTNHLETLAGLIEAFPDRGLYSTMHFIREGAEVFAPASPFSEDGGFCPVEDFFESFSLGLSLVNSSTAAVSRVKALALDGFPCGIRRGEDIILWTKLFLSAGMAHAPIRTAIYHRDALNRSSDLREQEPPGHWCIWQDCSVDPACHARTPNPPACCSKKFRSSPLRHESVGRRGRSSRHSEPGKYGWKHETAPWPCRSCDHAGRSTPMGAQVSAQASADQAEWNGRMCGIAGFWDRGQGTVTRRPWRWPGPRPSRPG